MQINRHEDHIDGIDVIIWSIHDDGQQIAHLDAHASSGLILNVEVDQGRRGEGLARALYEHADNELGLYHVPAWGRSADGDAFADAMGGEVMDDEEAIDILGFDDDQAAHIRELAGL